MENFTSIVPTDDSLFTVDLWFFKEYTFGIQEEVQELHTELRIFTKASYTVFIYDWMPSSETQADNFYESWRHLTSFWAIQIRKDD